MAFTKDGTLRGASTTGYRITLTPSKFYVQLMSKGGTFWVKRYAPGDVIPAAVPTVAAIPASGAQSDYVEIADGYTATFGTDDGTGIKKVGTQSVATIDVWCETAGDLLCVTQ